MNNKNPMSEATNLSGQESPTSSTSTFPQSAAAPHSNPFTGDVKSSEFTSDFGTNTNAVSQIFKGGGFGSSDKTKYIIIGVVVLALAVGGAFLLFDSEKSSDDSADNQTDSEQAADSTGDQAATDAQSDTSQSQDAQAPAATEQAAAEQPASQQQAASQAAAKSAGTTGSLSISQPNDGASHDYDETQGPAVFEWTGSADRIVFSRHSNMSPIERSVSLKGKTNYKFDHPYPGIWYWRVENSEGASETRRFVVNAPARRNFPVSQPTPGSSLSGNGGVVAWQGDNKVAWYAVQLVSPGASWANPQYRFGTSGTSIALQGVATGSYDMRVGAFSEVSGRWEWQEIKGVTIQ